ncbi:MAG: hypothetical protein QOG04_155 [Actinomycetota bacterium]|jgi:hypothetical protein|nr:hypothetical protein [Actinomycetota bacterium]
MRRYLGAVVLAILIVGTVAGPASACGGLVAANGSINLLRTATLAAYHDGIEHYVTSFEFAGGGAEFGSIVPLPGIPSDVKRGGEWTLQRLQQEVAPPQRFSLDTAVAGAAVAQKGAEVLLERTIDALDITVLKGGADEVGIWAKENGFRLPPDAPEVLDFYASRSPIFMAARFDIKRAAALDQSVGDGTPIHVIIPTPNPWVPLRILGLGRQPNEVIEADVFLLTDERPNLLPGPGVGAADGITIDRSEQASDLLMSDLRSDKGMRWLPTTAMHFTYMKIDSRAADLTHDLAIDASGLGIPSRIAAGLAAPAESWPVPETVPLALWIAIAAFGLGVMTFLVKGATMRWPV